MAVKLLLSGGLGNQMFQYAAIKAQALDIGASVDIDLRFYDEASPAMDKRPWLRDFPVACTFVSYSNKRQAHSIGRRLFRRFVSERRASRYDSRSIGFDPSLCFLRDGSVVRGLFQSPLHFQDHWDTLDLHLNLLHSGLVVPPNNFEGTPLRSYIGVHVRRGDYILHPGFEMADSLKYYADALAEVRLLGKRLLIFSDDVEWCRQQFIFRDAAFFDGAASPPYFSLFTLSQCNSLIIANSTFSWWAGWFAHQRGAQIIAPKMWFRGMPTSELKITPPEWLLL